MDLSKRERKVDLEAMSLEQADAIQKQLTVKMNEIVDEAVAKANRMLNIYGISVKMAIKYNKLPKAKKPRKKASTAAEAKVKA